MFILYLPLLGFLALMGIYSNAPQTILTYFHTSIRTLDVFNIPTIGRTIDYSELQIHPTPLSLPGSSIHPSKPRVHHVYVTTQDGTRFFVLSALVMVAWLVYNLRRNTHMSDPRAECTQVSFGSYESASQFLDRNLPHGPLNISRIASTKDEDGEEVEEIEELISPKVQEQCNVPGRSLEWALAIVGRQADQGRQGSSSPPRREVMLRKVKRTEVRPGCGPMKLIGAPETIEFEGSQASMVEYHSVSAALTATQLSGASNGSGRDSPCLPEFEAAPSPTGPSCHPETFNTLKKPTYPPRAPATPVPCCSAWPPEAPSPSKLPKLCSSFFDEPINTIVASDAGSRPSVVRPPPRSATPPTAPPASPTSPQNWRDRQSRPTLADSGLRMLKHWLGMERRRERISQNREPRNSPRSARMPAKAVADRFSSPKTKGICMTWADEMEFLDDLDETLVEQSSMFSATRKHVVEFPGKKLTKSAEDAYHPAISQRARKERRPIPVQSRKRSVSFKACNDLEDSDEEIILYNPRS